YKLEQEKLRLASIGKVKNQIPLRIRGEVKTCSIIVKNKETKVLIHIDNMIFEKAKKETKIMTECPEEDQSNSDAKTPILLQKVRYKISNYLKYYFALSILKNTILEKSIYIISKLENYSTVRQGFGILKFIYQEANSTKKRDIAIQEAQDLWNKLKEHGGTSTSFFYTIAKDTTKDITENTTEDMSKRQETSAQTKLKEELI
ncbi:5954_t:CDS:2, partial [Gigaspora margarita]